MERHWTRIHGKSTINDWIVCQPNDGSLVVQKGGLIICKNIKNVATACSGMAPDYLQWWKSGPVLQLTKDWQGLYYGFDGARDLRKPIHDPCGTNNANNHKKGVGLPGGQIYLR